MTTEGFIDAPADQTFNWADEGEDDYVEQAIIEIKKSQDEVEHVLRNSIVDELENCTTYMSRKLLCKYTYSIFVQKKSPIPNLEYSDVRTLLEELIPDKFSLIVYALSGINSYIAASCLFCIHLNVLTNMQISKGNVKLAEFQNFLNTIEKDDPTQWVRHITIITSSRGTPLPEICSAYNKVKDNREICITRLVAILSNPDRTSYIKKANTKLCPITNKQLSLAETKEKAEWLSAGLALFNILENKTINIFLRDDDITDVQKYDRSVKDMLTSYLIYDIYQTLNSSRLHICIWSNIIHETTERYGKIKLKSQVDRIKKTYIHNGKNSINRCDVYNTMINNNLEKFKKITGKEFKRKHEKPT